MKRPKISADFLALFPLILLFWQNSGMEMLLFLMAVILHEAGHLIFLWAFGYHAKSIRFSLVGAEIISDCELIPYRKEFFLYLSGPLFNFLGCVIAFFLIRFDFKTEFLFFFFCNALLALFNLLPLPGLDGERALSAFLCLFCEMDPAGKIVFFVSNFVLILFFLFAIMLFWQEKNPSLLIFCLWLFFTGKKTLLGAH